MSRRAPADPSCPCGSGNLFSTCCGPLLAGQAPAVSALALMRSRYTAYSIGDDPYVLATWHESTRPAALEQVTSNHPKWIGLTIRRHLQHDPDHAVVEFIARYRSGGRAHRLHETSRFVCEEGVWFYVDGDMHD